MPVSETFVVSKKDKKIRRSQDNSYAYWRGDKKGTIDLQIEVFGDYNHIEEAKLIYEALCKSGLQNRYFEIKIEVK